MRFHSWFMWGIIACGMLRFSGAICLAQDSGWIQGVIKAAPKKGLEHKNEGGGGAYGDRSMQDAVLFNYDKPGRFVVFASPAGEELTQSNQTVDVKIRLNRGRLQLEPNFFVVPAGGIIRLHNLDDSERNIFSAALSVKSFNVTIPPKSTKDIKCAKMGPIFIRSLDDEFLDAVGYVATPYSMVTDDKGRYKIQVPKGKYDVEAWHKRLPSDSKQVTVEAEETAKADFVLSVNELPQVE